MQASTFSEEIWEQRLKMEEICTVSKHKIVGRNWKYKAQRMVGSNRSNKKFGNMLILDNVWMWLSFGGPRTKPEESGLWGGSPRDRERSTSHISLHFAAATSRLASGAQPHSAATSAVTPEVLPTPSSTCHWLLRQHLAWRMLSGKPGDLPVL